MLTLTDLREVLRELRYLAQEDPIDEELRGWNWGHRPVKPPTRYIKLPVSELANRCCSTLRNIYLRYVRGVEPRTTYPLILGKYIHSIIRVHTTISRRIVLEGTRTGTEYISRIQQYEHTLYDLLTEENNIDLDREAVSKLLNHGKTLWNYLTIQVAAAIDKATSQHGKIIDQDALATQVLPQVVEYVVDGSRVGLSRTLRVDALTHNIILEYKIGRPEQNHKLALAAYALAIESSLEIPIDYGIITYITINNHVRITVEPTYISNELRREFLELRDEAIEIVLHQRDPGTPPNCPEHCPYKYICRGE
ncbi:MAG: type I-A CRISPR-associated protein Cas4/Csa1 [Thermoprotei archaeon]|nr:MAG: type I-A CRISPR-associated protein Cas4/Csa1 [Thermoprotei archaeon]